MVPDRFLANEQLKGYNTKDKTAHFLVGAVVDEASVLVSTVTAKGSSSPSMDVRASFSNSGVSSNRGLSNHFVSVIGHYFEEEMVY